MKIHVTYSKTVNLGNFESMKLEAGVERELRPSEDTDKAYQGLWDLVETEVEDQIEKKRPKGKLLGQRKTSLTKTGEDEDEPF